MQAFQPGQDSVASSGHLPEGATGSAAARFNAGLAHLESILAGLLLAGIFLLLLTNVVTRSLNTPTIWIDELAVYLMIWAGFLGAAVGIAKRDHIAVSLLPDLFLGKAGALFALAIDTVLLAFLIAFTVILWLWFDPIGLWQAGSAEALAAKTFNFLYQEPTTTLDMPKIWFWLILPIFACGALIHAGFNLAASAGRLLQKEGV